MGVLAPGSARARPSALPPILNSLYWNLIVSLSYRSAQSIWPTHIFCHRLGTVTPGKKITAWHNLTPTLFCHRLGTATPGKKIAAWHNLTPTFNFHRLGTVTPGKKITAWHNLTSTSYCHRLGTATPGKKIAAWHNMTCNEYFLNWIFKSRYYYVQYPYFMRSIMTMSLTRSCGEVMSNGRI